MAIENKFISSIENDIERIIPSKSDNMDIMVNDKTNEVIKQLFDSLKNEHINNWESMKGSEFAFDYDLWL